MDMMIAVILTIMTAATPLLLAALGELVVERSGVLNLGVEGMMVDGRRLRFRRGADHRLALARRCSPSIAAGMLMSLLFGFLTLTLVSNQVATGLALTLLGLGLSGLIGEAFVGQPGVKLPNYDRAIDPLIPLRHPAGLAAVSLVSCSAPRRASSSARWATAMPRRMRWAITSSGCAISACCSAAPAPDWPAAICRWSIRRNGSRT